METPVLACSLLLCVILISLNHSEAIRTQPFSHINELNRFLSKIYEWRGEHAGSQKTDFRLSSNMILAGGLCFLASSVSSAGGIGGGGLFIPILAIVAGMDLKTASSFSAFMVTGGSIANVMCSFCSGKGLINCDLALLSQPCMLLGVSVGVICNLVFPEWLITALFACFLAWSTSKTCTNGRRYWKIETEKRKENAFGEAGKQLPQNEIPSEEFGGSVEEPLLREQEDSRKSRLPWMKLGVLLLIWFSFFSIYILRGNRNGQSVITLEPCGVGYWILSSLQIPLAVAFTASILCRKDGHEDHAIRKYQDKDLTGFASSNKLLFPLMALFAGILGGVFGIGGGMLISPLLLQVGIAPEITAATCSFMVFFSSTMSAFQYLLLGMEHIEDALIFASICFFASLLGLLVIQRAIKKYGRASLIVFSVGIVMALSTLLMTSFGVLDVWRDYRSGKYMGFKLPC